MTTWLQIYVRKKRVDYKSPSEGPEIKFNKSVAKPETRVLEDTYFVDRIIWRREEREKKVSMHILH